jgi:3-(3-hydroxy-phenyl)propionate hydroxylase
MPVAEHEVVIAGGGPTGMMLAAELQLANVDVAIVERRASQEIESSRAGGLHARSIEILDQRGIADRFVSQGQKYPLVWFNLTPLNIGDLPSRHNYTLGLWQKRIERIMAEWLDELSVRIYRSREVTGFNQDQQGVDVALADGQSIRAQYLVGCDGGRSVVRKTAGIEFPGWDATTSWLIGEVETSEEPQWGMRHDADGIHGIGKVEEGGRRLSRIVITEAQPVPGEPTFDDLRKGLIAVYGTDFGAHSPRWVSRFTDLARQAAKYRERRVLLAGDAAHVHAPVGGQGLNIGVQDAVNLGWKLAQVIRKSAPQTLLDTYHAERHPVAARVLQTTMAQIALRRTDDRSKALQSIFGELLGLDEPRQRIAAMMTGLDVRYDCGEGHPLLGRRMPDLDLITAEGPRRFFTLLHSARPVLLNLDEPGALGIAPWRDRVQLIDAKYEGRWELPALGSISAPSAVLIRPDGYAAWVGERGQQGLAAALTAWFGPPAA